MADENREAGASDESTTARSQGIETVEESNVKGDQELDELLDSM